MGPAGSQEGMVAETDAGTKCLPVVPAASTFAGSGQGSEARGLSGLIVITNSLPAALDSLQNDAH